MLKTKMSRKFFLYCWLFYAIQRSSHCTYFTKSYLNKAYEEYIRIPSCPSLLTCTHKCNLKKLHAVYKNKQCYCVQLFDEENSKETNGLYERMSKSSCSQGYAGSTCQKVEIKLSEGKPATQSSTFIYRSRVLKPMVASKGVDGDTNGDLIQGLSCFSTMVETAPWWQVDIMENAVITSVTLHPRTDCCSSRAANLEILVKFADTTEWNTCASIKELDFTNLNSKCEEEIFGRIVRLVQYNNAQFHLCEVEVYGYLNTY